MKFVPERRRLRTVLRNTCYTARSDFPLSGCRRLFLPLGRIRYWSARMFSRVFIKSRHSRGFPLLHINVGASSLLAILSSCRRFRDVARRRLFVRGTI